jgi:hypothetical protein
MEHPRKIVLLIIPVLTCYVAVRRNRSIDIQSRLLQRKTDKSAKCSGDTWTYDGAISDTVWRLYEFLPERGVRDNKYKRIRHLYLCTIHEVHRELWNIVCDERCITSQCSSACNRKERQMPRYIFTGAYSRGWTFGLHFRSFLITHIQTRGRTPLDELLARRRGLYLHRTT